MGVVLFLVVAPLVQVLAVNRSPWGGPDLVVLAVVWPALAGGPGWGCAAGFAAGLAADVTPPAGGTVGASAVALAVTGLLTGLSSPTGTRWARARMGRAVALGTAGAVPGMGRAVALGAGGAVLGVGSRAGMAVALGDMGWREAWAGLPATLAWTAALGAPLAAALLRRRRPRTGRGSLPGADPWHKRQPRRGRDPRVGRGFPGGRRSGGGGVWGV
ncbi:hypothetical protein MF672_023845 [Actinomadura sp. ATCC 31491]|uniref:Rod shape-determining protein MreD n=1 Tax=Actinomadura luzonensis TaxID=2805427 RepID=A0ABT0FWU6_9ACTN|nr:hypothetical protein [Actinomadura luzonensis]MCK2216803.1 hypothetical protein [Actinomadura luzonensis]